jgi:hypothetical protein
MKTQKNKKFTIEQIFNWISEELPYLKFNYDKAKKTKGFKESPLPFELFCLMIFDKVHN